MIRITESSNPDLDPSLPWLPDGYSQIFRAYVFGPSASGLWLRYATLQNLTPFFPWIVPGCRADGVKQKRCHLATLALLVVDVSGANEGRLQLGWREGK